MSDNPSYVRLAVRLNRGILCDINGSGWAISGLDVLPFPKDRQAARYVTAELNSGKLEPASKAEYDEVQEANASVAKEVLRQHPDHGKSHQEGAMNDVSRAATAALEEKHGVDEEAEFQAALEADTENRRERLAAQAEAKKEKKSKSSSGSKSKASKSKEEKEETTE